MGGDDDCWDAGGGRGQSWEVTLEGLGAHLEASGIVACFEALKRGSKPVLGGTMISDRCEFAKYWAISGLGTRLRALGIVASFSALTCRWS